MQQNFCVGQEVIRLGSVKEYTTLRVGTIIEINEQTKRARVHWIKEKDGSALNVRTWVGLIYLKPKVIL